VTNPFFAAICFEDGQDIDALLQDFLNSDAACGLTIRGVMQSRASGAGACHCADMDLRAIGSGTIFRISQPLGSGSSGCRLHPGALADCSAYLEKQLQEGADLLVLNRFGKGESEGRGFRDLISAALLADIPVLIAMRPTYREDWKAFSGDYGVELPFDPSAIAAWLAALEHADAA
jgi:hypothetical protein